MPKLGAQGVVYLGTPPQALPEIFRLGGDDHKLLDVDIVGGMGSTV